MRVVEGRHSYLLFHRNPRPDLGLPAFWQGVSGALEPGESFTAAALREVAEETGIVLTSVSDSRFQHSYPIRAEWRPFYGPEPMEVKEQVFFAKVPVDVKPTLSKEHQSWRWCSVSEAAALLTFGGNAGCLRAVEEAAAPRDG